VQVGSCWQVPLLGVAGSAVPLAATHFSHITGSTAAAADDWQGITDNTGHCMRVNDSRHTHATAQVQVLLAPFA